MGVSEARPIDLKRLTEWEIDALQQLNNQLHDMICEEPDPSPTDSPWARIEQHRSGRVLAIDGARGTGKTSLLLTLLQQWRDSEDGGPQAEVAGTSDRLGGLREILRKVGRKSRALPVLDFEPLPEAIPLHGWLLQPWKRLAELADGGPRRSPAPAEASESLCDRWHDLFETATIGWTSLPPDNRGVVERALDYHEQSSDLLNLRPSWWHFVDKVMKSLEQVQDHSSRLPLPPKALLIVPIDDVDLQVRRLPELIQALRLLHHPRVAYLLTADMKHLKKVLELDYLRRHRQASSWQGNAAKEDEEVADHSRVLATAALEKAIPLHARFRLAEVGLEDILEYRLASDRDAQSIREILKSLDTGIRNSPDTTSDYDNLGEYLAKNRDSLAGTGLLTFRELQHLADRITSTEPGRERAQQVVRGIVDPERRYTKTDDAEGKPLRYRRAATISALCRTSDRILSISKQAEVALGFSWEFSASDNERPNNGAFAALLKEGGVLESLGLTWEVANAFVWTQWRFATPAVFVWPFFSQPTLPMLRPIARTWEDTAAKSPGQQNVGSLRPEKFDEFLDYLARAWIQRSLDWENSTDEIKEDWHGICEHAWSWAGKDSEKLKTVHLNLLQLASPGIALPLATSNEIIKQLRAREEARSNLPEQWDRWLTDAIIYGDLQTNPEAAPPGEEEKSRYDKILRHRSSEPKDDKWLELYDAAAPSSATDKRESGGRTSQ